MTHVTSPRSLTSLVATCNIDFGYRLLRVARGDELSFDDFVSVAESLIGEDRTRAAMHLAGLVAMDIAESRERAETRGTDHPARHADRN